MKRRLICFLWCSILGMFYSIVPSFAGHMDIPEGLFHIDFTSEELNNIQSLFPERQQPHPSFVNSQTDPNIHLINSAEITVTFIDEGAGYRNKFGYFTFDDNHNILYEETLFENASKVGGGGPYVAGDSLVIGEFQEGEHVGFWLQANGYNNPNGFTYYTLDEYNPDGLRHMAIMSDEENERLIVGIEDLYNLGDKDYNDIIFTFSINPFDAIDRSSIPTGAPAPAAAATAGISAIVYSMLAWKNKMFKRNKTQGGEV